MEKRSRRRTRELVTHSASQGLSENEIGCARISMMARSTKALCKGLIQMRKTPPPFTQIRLATHGRSIQLGHKPTSDQIDPTTICRKVPNSGDPIRWGGDDAFDGVGALIARPPTRLRRVSKPAIALASAAT